MAAQGREKVIVILALVLTSQLINVSVNASRIWDNPGSIVIRKIFNLPSKLSVAEIGKLLVQNR